jgi:hypothetical protein
MAALTSAKHAPRIKANNSDFVHQEQRRATCYLSLGEPVTGQRQSREARIGCLTEVGFGLGQLLFNAHVFEFAGVEDLAAFQAFDKFFIIFAGNNLNTRVLTLWHSTALLGVG